MKHTFPNLDDRGHVRAAEGVRLIRLLPDDAALLHVPQNVIDFVLKILVYLIAGREAVLRAIDGGWVVSDARTQRPY